MIADSGSAGVLLSTPGCGRICFDGLPPLHAINKIES